MSEVERLHRPAAEVSEEALKRAEEMIEREEGVQNRFGGWRAGLIGVIAVVMSVFHLYTAYAILRPEHLRATHVAFVLVLTFLVFPMARRFRHRIMPWDWLLAGAGIATAAYLIAGGDNFFDRSILPETWDIVLGVVLMGLYEIQIFDSYNEKLYPDGQCAAVYAQTPPLVNVTRKPGQWQSFDIMFTAPKWDGDALRSPPRITMLHNGVLVHLNQEIFGETGHKVIPRQRRKVSTGPIILAGHDCPVRFRNIWARKL